jgi:BirA family transcriptional regulator, biotin operon repressor / biotin---[acetyl-CoA-carboxylase] ligase
MPIFRLTIKISASTQNAVPSGKMKTKDQLLTYLRENKGTWISGELLSNNLSITRAAVWKHIRKFKDDGYGIQSSPKKGYLFGHDSELLLPDEIRQGLKTRVFGKEDIHYFRETDSTHTRAKDLANQGAPEGTLVIAEAQTLGRGRMGRTWYSSSGNGICASLILRPQMSPNGAPRITLMTAVAIAEALLSQVKLNIRIKWPNDILIGQKKLVGILTEISAELDSINYILVGFGLNVNTRQEDFPEEVRNIATSIRIETGEPFSRVKLFRACLEEFERYYNMFIQGDFEMIMDLWKRYSNTIGQKITVDVLGQRHVGKVVDVDDSGVLILKDPQGKLHRIFSGDITPTQTP